MHVLIVEDDRQLGGVMRDGLEETGITADVVNDADGALRAATSGATHDVIVLDVMLGQGPDGFEVCRRLRERRVPSAVLMLTALDAVPDRVRGLNAGADDYLVKPFAFSELVARLHALRRRHRAEAGAVLEGRGMRLDPLSRRVSVCGAELPLTRKEFDILELLMANPELVIAKERILERVWGHDTEQGSGPVEVHMARLRRKIAAAGGDDCIRTVRNLGYRFERDRADRAGDAA